jgi:hypothetical protein
MIGDEFVTKSWTTSFKKSLMNIEVSSEILFIHDTTTSRNFFWNHITPVLCFTLFVLIAPEVTEVTGRIIAFQLLVSESTIFRDCKFQDCRSGTELLLNTDGGAISFGSKSYFLILVICQFTKCTAVYCAGAIFLVASSSFSMSRSSGHDC